MTAGSDEDEARGANGPELEGVAAAPAARMPTAMAEVFIVCDDVIEILRGNEVWRKTNKDVSERCSTKQARARTNECKKLQLVQ